MKGLLGQRLGRLVPSLGPNPGKARREQIMRLRPVQNDFARDRGGQIVLRAVRHDPRTNQGNFDELPSEWSVAVDVNPERWPQLQQRFLVPVVSLAVSGDGKVA